MPNRILKESICTSETIAALKPEEELFFYRLLVNCDDYGRMDGRGAILRARCFPLVADRITEASIEEWLEALAKVGLIRLYVVGGRRYLQVVTWEKHQQIRAKKSKYPGPPPSDGICNQMLSNDDICPRNPNPNQNPVTSPSEMGDEAPSNPREEIDRDQPELKLVPTPGAKQKRCPPSAPAFTDSEKAPVDYLKARLQAAGMYIPRDWHLKGYSISKAILARGVPPDDLIACIDWALSDPHWAKQVDSMASIQRCLPRWQAQRRRPSGLGYQHVDDIIDPDCARAFLRGDSS